MNRDQIINKSIQNTMKMLLKNRKEKKKTLKITTVERGPKAKTGPRPARRAPPPRPGHSVGLGRKIGPRSAHSWAECGPTGGDRSWPSDLIRRPAASLAGSKPGRRPPRNPRTFSLSPFSLHAKQRRPRRRRPWRPRRRGWRRHRPPRRRTRSAQAGARRRRVAWRRCPEPARARTSGVPDGERRSPSGPHPGERRRRTFP